MTLQLSGIDVVRSENTLLEDVSIEVEPGRVVAVLGPNGAGKSTLMNVAMGDITPDAGSVQLNGEPLQEWESRHRARIMAMLPQLSLLNFPYTAEEVVQLGRTPHATGRLVDKQVSREALAQMDCLHLSERLYPQLSGGEKQRIQLARILAQLWNDDIDNSRYLLLDEPTAALDLAHQHQVLNVVRQRAQHNYGVLLVLHDFNLAASVADDILMLKDGRVVASGSPDKVLTSQCIEEVFGASVHILPHPVTGLPVVVG